MAATVTQQDRLAAEALRQDSERRKLEDIGARDAVRIARNLSIAVLRAYRLNESIGAAIESSLEEFTLLLTDAMTAAHLQGRLRSLLSAQAAIKRSLSRSFAVTVYDEARRFTETRLMLEATEVDSIASMYNRAAVDVTRNVGTVAERAARKASENIVAEGMHVREGMTTMRSGLESAGVTGAQPHLLETLVRTQTQLAYGAGRWSVNQDPAIDEILWGYRYETVGDDRVRPNHAMLQGTTLEKNSPRWDTIWPPCGFNCRCTTVEIYKSDHAEQVITPPPQAQLFDGKLVHAVPDKDFDFNPGKVYRDTMSLRPELQPIRIPATAPMPKPSIAVGEE